MSDFIGWMLTPELRRHLLTYIPLDTLLTTIAISKEFEETMRDYIGRRVESGELIFHRGEDIAFDRNRSDEEKRALGQAAKKKNKLVTQSIFLQNLPRVGDNACILARNLIVVDIPEGVEKIGEDAFIQCKRLTNVSFPTTLRVIGYQYFAGCYSLENVDLLHTNLQELGRGAFGRCGELKSMTTPDSHQTLGLGVFFGCLELVPSSIDVNDFHNDTTREVVAHLGDVS